LQPGEVATATQTALSMARSDDIADVLSWRDGRYAFSEQPLGKVLDNLRRYYSGAIFVMNDRLNTSPVSGNYRLDDPVGVVRSLANVTGATMTVLPGGIIVLR
jgi:transmembrane sensor